jgi:hypothetical protein
MTFAMTTIIILLCFFTDLYDCQRVTYIIVASFAIKDLEHGAVSLYKLYIICTNMKNTSYVWSVNSLNGDWGGGGGAIPT